MDDASRTPTSPHWSVVVSGAPADLVDAMQQEIVVENTGLCSESLAHGCLPATCLGDADAYAG